MSIFSNLFRRRQESVRIGGMDDFMTLIRVYFQAVMANQLGITNLAVLPDLRVFKQSLKVQTVNNRLGLGERKRCQRMLTEMYGLQDGFFKEIDTSIKKHCRTVRDMQPYLLIFQDLSQNLMLCLGQLMQWKLRLPSFFRNALRRMTEKTVRQVLTSNEWKDASMRKCAVAVRKAQARLGYTEGWLVDYGHTFLMLAKKEPRNKIDAQE